MKVKDILRPKSKEDIIFLLENTNLKPNKLLVQSAKAGFLFGVKKALERDADVHAHYDAALREASMNGHKDIVEFLLKNGADVHVYNDNPLRWASASALGLGLDIVELLLKYGADVHAADNAPLQVASSHGNINVVELLLKNGADVHAQNNEALQWALKGGHLDVVKLLKKYMKNEK